MYEPVSALPTRKRGHFVNKSKPQGRQPASQGRRGLPVSQGGLLCFVKKENNITLFEYLCFQQQRGLPCANVVPVPSAQRRSS